MKSKVTRKFQVTIPKEIREALGINVGDIVVWEIGKGGVAILKKFEEKGILKTLKVVGVRILLSRNLGTV